MSTTTSIQNLDTSANPPASSSIHAVITLIWPYSSSTRQYALLLSEEDFRLRARGGQIRVKFSGPAARAVAEKKLGIGDRIILNLENGEWVRDEGGTAIHVPGKSVGELHFGRGVRLRIQKDGAAEVEINVAEDTVEDIEEEDVRSQVTPAKQMLQNTGARSTRGSTAASAAIYSSPAFMRRSAKFSYLDGISRLFEDELESQDLPRKKARISIGDVREWRVVDRTPSPERTSAKSRTNDREEAEIPATAKEMSEERELRALSVEKQGPLTSTQPDQGSPTLESIRSQHDKITQTRSGNEQEPVQSIGATSIEVEYSTATQAANVTAPLPQLHLPSASPTPQQSQDSDMVQSSAGPVTPRLQPLSSAALPSTTPQISPLATKNASHIQSEDNPAEIVEFASNRDTGPESGVDDLHPSMQPGQDTRTLPGSREPDDDEDDSAADLSDGSVISEQPVTADAQDNDVLTAQDHGFVVHLNSGSDAEAQDAISDLERDEEDDLMMDEDDAEAVFDADELEGNEPSDNDADEDVEMQASSDEVHELPEDSEEIEESDLESEGQQTPLLQNQGDVQSQSPPTTREQPGFAPASTLLSTSQSFSKADNPVSVVEADASTTPVRKPAFGMDGAVPSTEVTPLARPTHSPKKTPQSAQDRAMKLTMQRLFGLKGTPSPEKERSPKPDLEHASFDPSVNDDGISQGQQREQEPTAYSPNSRAEFETRSHLPEAKEDSQMEPSSTTADKTAREPVELIELDDDDDEDQEQRSTDQNSITDQAKSKPVVTPQQRSSRQSVLSPFVDQARGAKDGLVPHDPSEDAPEEELPPKLDASAGQQQPTEVPSVSPRRNPILQQDSHEELVMVPEQKFVNVPNSFNLHPELDADEQEMQDATAFAPAQFEGSLAPDSAIPESGSFNEFIQIPDSLEQADAPVPDQDKHVMTPDAPFEARESVQGPMLIERDPELPGDLEAFRGTENATTITAELVENQMQSSPGSFKSQTIDEELDTQRLPSASITSRPVSRGSVEAFSPVVLGSLSKINTAFEDVNGQETSTTRMEFNEQDQHVEQTRTTQSNDGNQEASEHVELTPTRTEKQTTVIDLESSPSEPQEFSPVKITQEALVEEEIPQQLPFDDNRDAFLSSDGSIAADPSGSHAQAVRDAQARDIQLQETSDVNEQPFSVADHVQDHQAEDNVEDASPDIEQSARSEAPLDPSLLPSVMSETHLPHVDTTKTAILPTPATSQSQPIVRTRTTDKHNMETLKKSGVDEHTAEKASMQPPQPLAPATPARRSLRSRLSNVPDVISAWFSPKRSSIAAQEAEKPAAPAQLAASTAEVTDKVQPAKVHSDGISTAHAYFTSLSALDQHLNPSTQQAYGSPGVVDVLAVVTDLTKEPERAKGGPRDYYTVFRITDPSMTSSQVRVEVFRPWKAVLPAAAAGDVVLLRAFVVKSKKRQSYLLSTDTSGWCVWRFAELGEGVAHHDDTNSEKPAWARRRSHSDVREEIKGPPVEYGNAEKEQAKKLRDWWLERQLDSQNGKAHGENGGGHGNEVDAAML